VRRRCGAGEEEAAMRGAGKEASEAAPGQTEEWIVHGSPQKAGQCGPCPDRRPCQPPEPMITRGLHLLPRLPVAARLDAVAHPDARAAAVIDCSPLGSCCAQPGTGVATTGVCGATAARVCCACERACTGGRARACCAGGRRSSPRAAPRGPGSRCRSAACIGTHPPGREGRRASPRARLRSGARRLRGRRARDPST
jgi:hypothetical protein